MWVGVRRRGLPECLLWACLMAGGCEALHEAGVPGRTGFVDRHAGQREEESYRKQYQIERDPKAMRWLLGHRLQPGMSVADVNQVFGDEGEREFNDRRIKANSGEYLNSDVFYKWGPDSDGNSVILGFREGKLTNFRPDEFR